MKSLQIFEDLHICQYCNSHINIFDTSKTISNKENNVCSIHIMSKAEIKLGLNVCNLLYFCPSLVHDCAWRLNRIKNFCGIVM